MKSFIISIVRRGVKQLHKKRRKQKMCAATSQMVAKVAELMELRKMIEDLNAEAELIADEIKAYMGEEETMTAGS